MGVRNYHEQKGRGFNVQFHLKNHLKKVMKKRKKRSMMTEVKQVSKGRKNMMMI